MSTKFVYITNRNWFENTSLKNPLSFLDSDLEKLYPDFYSTNYDLKILATKDATEEEKKSSFYNDFREMYGNSDISVLDEVVSESKAVNVFLSGFNQKQFEYIAPLIEDTTEILYLFKCKNISNLSLLSKFKKLKCVLIFANNSLKSLWDMKRNDNLKVLSFIYVTKLQYIEPLVDSLVEYVKFDSADNYGNLHELFLDESVFPRVKRLKYLSLNT